METDTSPGLSRVRIRTEVRNRCMDVTTAYLVKR